MNVIVLSTNTHALSGTCFFSGGTCSVDWYGYYGDNDVLSGRDSDGGGRAIPPYNSWQKEEFIKFIVDRYNSVNSQDNTGASFLIQKMRGVTIPAARPGAAEVNDWVRRMRQSGVSIDRTNVDLSTTSYYDPENNDDFFTSYSTSGREVIRVIYNGAVYAQIETACGNLVAGAMPIPEINYTLEPRVTLNPSDYIEAGETFNAYARIYNQGPTDSGPTDWVVQRTRNGTEVNRWSGRFVEVDPLVRYVERTIMNENISDTSLESPGTEICIILTVFPRSTADNPQRQGQASDCVKIGKKPKVQVWGGDLRVGKNSQTSTTVKSENTFGSWVEYAIFATGSIRGTASGSAFASTTGLSGVTSPANYSTLSFANAIDNSNCTPTKKTGIGCYEVDDPPDVAASFPSVASVGDVTIGTRTYNPGESVIIKSSGTVIIAGNQTYNGGPYNNISNLPQLVIIANKIIINRGVTNVDAWLIANGTDGEIYTCDIVGDTDAKCNQKLTVNGPVIAKHLYLRRTAGSDTGPASGESAETFNLRADSYLWAMSRASSAGRIRTVYQTELPPRL